MVKIKYPESDIHINNRQRLVRALNKTNRANNGNKLLYDAIFIGLTTGRATLYERINRRVDKMFDDGLLDEVKGLYKQNVNGKAVKTAIGYKELYEYLDKLISLEEAKDLIKKRSRHYAKRQYTWFNNQMNIKWFDVDFDNFNNTFEEVCDYLNLELDK
jgi:tRNA dimethylallyltransferase